MEELKTLVVQAQRGDLNAYGQIVRRFQNMAVGYAYSILGDFHLAEDASQEAFIRAYLDLSQLREPTAFSGWFRKIVSVRCSRLTRGKRVPTVPLEVEMASDKPGPDEIAEIQEMKDRVRWAVQALSEREREVTALFYIDGYSQNEIGEFLEIPSRTVKSRLHTARTKLRERMMDMVKEHLYEQRPSRDETFVSGVIDDLARFTDREIQMILHEVDTRDLVIALKGIGEELKERIFANVSERVRTLIEEEMVYAGSVPPEDIKERHARIMKVVQLLVQAGQLTWPPAERRAAGRKPKRPPDREYLARKTGLKEKLQHGRFSRLGFDAVNEIITDLAEVGRVEGILALEELGCLTDEELVQSGIRLAVDGGEPKLIQTILSTRIDDLMHHHETRYRMILEGLQSIQAGDSPRITEYKLRAFHMPPRNERVSYAGASIHDLQEKLREARGDQPGLGEITEILTDMAIIARTESIGALEEVVGVIDDELLAQGLRLAIDGTDPDLVQRILATRMQGLLHQRETRYKMIAEGIRSIQWGDGPSVIAERMRCFYAS